MKAAQRPQSSSLGLAVFAGTLTCIFIVSAIWGMAGRADSAALSRDTALARNGLNLVIREVQETVNRSAVWDDAVANLDNTFNPAWARANIETYFRNVSGFERSFVIDADGEPVFASADGGAEAFPPYRQLGGIIVDIVRSREAERGPYRNIRPGRQIISRPVTQSIIGVIDGRLVLLTAALVQPDSGRALPRGAKAPIIVMAQTLDERFLAQFSERFLLDGVTASIGPAGAPRGRGEVAIHDAYDRTVATLHWRPVRPGSKMLASIAAPLAVVMLLLGFVVSVLMKQRARYEEELRAGEAQAKHMAQHDALTGLPNRALLIEHIEIAIHGLRETGQTPAVHLIDLDRFKEVNDTLGHNAGDELICAVASRLLPLCAPGETLARLGGDEFALVQRNVDEAAALAMAGRLLLALAEPMELSAGHVQIGASVGVAVVDCPNLDPIETIRRADMALYASKADGRGRATAFHPEMDATLRERRRIEIDLRTALASGGLYVVYQPLVDGDGLAYGFESLLRWRHPTRGELAPGMFVPIAEECGLIEEIGLYTLRRTFEDARRFPHHRFAINVSAHQLRTGSLPLRLAALTAELGVRPAQFELEITERVLLGDGPQTLAQLRQLKAMGFTIVLDDFGTGYSSLSYLHRYPVDKIKIDRSFVRGLGRDPQADVVVHAIVNIARALGIRVLAEGVETDHEYAALRLIGCHEAQGFLFGRPAPVEKIAERLANLEAERAA
jgi:diguanylate cyclase (GGDEF)-like protein